MSDSSDTNRNPIEELAEEFMARGRAGETPSIEEYVERYPALADEIRATFAALAVVEDLKPAAEDEPTIGSDDNYISARVLPEIPEYRIFGEIGRGGMGIVYEAEHLSLGRRVALKVLPTGPRGDETAVERFRQEARAAAAMHHSNIVPVFDVGQTDQHKYYAMQYIVGDGLDRVIQVLRDLRDGGSRDETNSGSEVSQRLALALTTTTPSHSQERAQQGGRGLSSHLNQPADTDTATRAAATTSNISALSTQRMYTRNIASIGAQVADALQHAHDRGVIHRDIKPSNVLLDTEGRPWVADFGLAKKSDVSLTQTGNILGTLRYMSPERFSGPCDAAGDVYSLGATLYELLSLKPVHPASAPLALINAVKEDAPVSLRTHDPSVPKDLQTIVEKALEKQPERRYRSARAMADDLQRFLDGRPIRARRVSATERLMLWAKNNKAIASMLALIIVALLGVAIYSRFERNRFEALAIQETAARERSDDILGIVAGAFNSVAPASGGRVDMSAADVLQQALDSVDESELDNVGKCKLFNQLRECFVGIGEYELAIQAAEACYELASSTFADDSHESLQYSNTLATAYHVYGKYEKAMPIYEATLPNRKKISGLEHHETLKLMNNLALCYRETNRTEEAAQLLAEVVPISKKVLGSDHDHTLHFILNQGVSFLELGKNDEAVAVFEELLDIRETKWGPDHPTTLKARTNLAASYQYAGRLEEAAKVLEHNLEISRSTLGPEHPETSTAMYALSDVYFKMNRTQEAAQLVEQAIELAREQRNSGHYRFRAMLNKLAEMYAVLGRWTEAITLAEEAIELYREHDGPDHRQTLNAMSAYAGYLSEAGRVEEALLAFQNVLDGLQGWDEPATEVVLQATYEWVWCVVALSGDYGQLDTAKLDVLRKAEAEEQDAPLLRTLALAEYRLENFAEAIEAARAAIDKSETEQHVIEWAILAMAHSQLSQSDEARPYLKKFRNAREADGFEPDRATQRLSEELERLFSQES